MISRLLANWIGHVEIKTESDLLPPGAKPGTVPTDLEQATGLERLEILGKVQGVDIFDMRPLDASRVGMSLHQLPMEQAYWEECGEKDLHQG